MSDIDPSAPTTFPNVNVQHMRRSGQRITFVTPDHVPVDVIYMCSRMGKPCPKGTAPTKKNLCFFRRIKSHKNLHIDASKCPEWIQMLVDEVRPGDAKSGKLRWPTLKEWDSIAQIKRLKKGETLNLDQKAVVNKKTNLIAPIYSSEYLAHYTKKQKQKTKTASKTTKPKAVKRKRASNATSKGSTDTMTPEQQEIYKRVKKMTVTELQADASLAQTLGPTIMYELFAKAKPE